LIVSGNQDSLPAMTLPIRFFLLFAAIFYGPFCTAQQISSSVGGGLEAYTSCNLPDGLSVVDVAPLAPGVTSRTVDTSQGPRQIDMLAGKRIMFAYPNTDFYANVKAEKLPANNYEKLKGFLIENFDYILATSKESSRNYSLKPTLNNFAISGLDQSALSGGVLGIYLLFDDNAHVVTTIYLLNQEPAARKFQTIEEYRKLRDQFLSGYTSCIRKNQMK
jgi:hypothetical protein